jgi:hypothetical protein
MSDRDQSACYAAEWATGFDRTARRFVNTDDLRDFTENVLLDPRVRELFPTMPLTLDVKITTNKTTSWSSKDGRIRISKYSCNVFTLLHEIAHQVSNDGHGPHFRLALLVLVRRFMTVSDHANLKFEFTNQGLSDNPFAA